MLELKKCCTVPFPEKLFEAYEIDNKAIYANVNASKVIEMMRFFINSHNEPMFFILEIPCEQKDEISGSKVLYNTDDIDVYFADGLNTQTALSWLDSLGDFLVSDGLNVFGFGGHESKEEILFGKYNVMTIYTSTPENFSSFFDCFNIEKTDKLITAWDTFDMQNAGECTLLTSESTGKTIYDIPAMYKDYGLYLYEKRNVDEKYSSEVTKEDLTGKILLVGLTYYTGNNEFIEQKQFYGKVTEANDSHIIIKCNDGSELNLPPDLSSTKRARPGEYTLSSTNEVVINPDFIATWNVIEDQ